MLDIVINSLYQNKDIFLRELISNASDALDKLRLLELSDPDNYKKPNISSGDIPLEVKILFDPEQQTVTIRDTGIGMTKADLIGNLGTVARSGTTKFIESLSESGKSEEAMTQIGKFGVGTNTRIDFFVPVVAGNQPQALHIPDPLTHVAFFLFQK